MRKNKQNAQKATTSDEQDFVPPFDRGFWSGRKGSAVGSSSAAGSNYDGARHQDPIFARTPAATTDSGTSSAYPADLRREGPFAKDKVVVPKATISTAAQTGVFQSSSGVGVRTVGANNLPNSPAGGQVGQKPILQLDDFEPQTKAWRRTQKEPVAPRVHPNPTPVVPVKGKAAKAAAAKNKAATGAKFTAPSADIPLTYAAPHTSVEKPSIVMPLAMIFTLIVLIGGGYFYLSNLSQQNANEQNLASRERQIKLVETMLLNLDYKPGLIDGRIDGDLTNAVRAFQRDSLLAQDGEITPQLITELEAILAIYEAS